MKGGKLMVRWMGPFSIVQELPTSFLIENLLTTETFDVHAIRLKHYADDMLSVTEEIKHHMSLQGINLGLEDAKDSWKSMGGIVKAVPEIRGHSWRRVITQGSSGITMKSSSMKLGSQVLGEVWTNVQVSDLPTPYSG
ncbi:uncharacterized protein PHALS_02078 [Plasmopara halstedii]|uniref:Uncharacterized protein n=1 Tax=Plasmopara halstedii TaxID=4781 RepID=A0A0P1AW63_PLAHL|nr:uncharacterized protein PHALS_02078 [Plasmopara halstedii]CEG45806.1 hypothetical protein PHALS_02078 [Plasmopara halstedii]|eukprot:XP_024582175.1 hypothetical protein PHALS_02078 [Plasmopara halstedii]